MIYFFCTEKNPSTSRKTFKTPQNSVVWLSLRQVRQCEVDRSVLTFLFKIFFLTDTGVTPVHAVSSAVSVLTHLNSNSTMGGSSGSPKSGHLTATTPLAEPIALPSASVLPVPAAPVEPPLFVHFAAGTFGGIFGLTLCYPLDTAKGRNQSCRNNKGRTIDTELVTTHQKSSLTQFSIRCVS